MPKRTTANKRDTGLRIALVTLDGHLGGAADRAIAALRRGQCSRGVGRAAKGMRGTASKRSCSSWAFTGASDLSDT